MAREMVQEPAAVASHPAPPNSTPDATGKLPVDLLCCVGYSDPTPPTVHQTLVDCGILPTDLPSGPTQLDPVETSTVESRNPLVPLIDDEPAAIATAFRHSFWQHRRARIREALDKTGASDHILTRFDTCGCNCWVMRATDNSGRLRLAADRCHNRWCEACQTERRRLIARNLIAGLADKQRCKDRLRFVTLTLKSNDAPLNEQLDRIYSCWQRLRQRPRIKKAIAGTIAFFEVTRNADKNQWHPHIHALVEGDYIAKQVLSDEWKSVTGDSFIVDIKLIRAAAGAAGYVAKYAAKAVSANVWQNADALHEAMLAFRNRRLFNTTGTFKKMKLSVPPEDDTGWEPLMPLHKLIAQARAGVPDAVHILRSLRSSNATDPIDGNVHDPPSA
jgi:replication protein